jgi:hypothetical protein
VEGVVVSVGRRVLGYGDRQGRFHNDTVRLRGDVSRVLTPWMKDFEERRHREAGIFLGAEDVIKHAGSLTALNLLSWAGVEVAGGGRRGLQQPRQGATHVQCDGLGLWRDRGVDQAIAVSAPSGACG